MRRWGTGSSADLFAIDAKGGITIVEVKVSKADLRGDGKWPDYLDYCDRFFWAVPQGFDLSPFEEPGFRPDIILADYHLDAGESGLTAVNRLRKAQGVPIHAVVITADHSREVAEAVASASCEILRKPVKPAELRALITHLVA